MKKLVFIFCLALCVTTTAQPKINWGDIQASRHTGSDYLGIKTEDEQNIYMIKKDHVVRERDMWYLECISKLDKKIVYTAPLLTPVTPDKKPVKWNTVVNIGTKLYLLSSYFDATGLFNIYASLINTTSGDIQETKLIYTTINRSKQTPFFHYSLVPDKSKMLICPVPLDPQNNEVKIVDENLQDVWKGLIIAPVILSPIYYYDLLMDANNNLIIYSNDYNKNELPVNQKIILYNTNNGQSNILNINTTSNCILYSEKIKLYDNNKLYLAGLLFDTTHVTRTGGIYTALIDLDKQDYLNAQPIIFDEQKINTLNNVGKKGGGTFSGPYVLKNIFFRPNGTITLLAEQESPYYYGQYSSSLVFTCNVTPRGYINWLTLIPKYQLHANKEYLSFTTGYDDNHVYLIFNDNYKNANIISGESPHCMDNIRESVTALVSVDDYGTVNKKIIYSEDEASYLSIKPILCSKLKNNELLLFTEKENAIRLGEITLK